MNMMDNFNSSQLYTLFLQNQGQNVVGIITATFVVNARLSKI